MSPWFREVLLVLFSMVLLFVELFVPSGGALMLAAVLCYGYAVYTVFADGETTVGWVLVLSMVVYSLVLFRFWISKVRLPDTLAESEATGRDVEAATALIGREGTTITPLRPAGLAKIAGDRYDVVTDGTFLEKGVSIVVVETAGNRILVRRAGS
ncbi:MAG: NfeD family protein [Planctomycetota bacterium]|jgi:membrane-bound serine protease (ClpP class)